MEVLHRRSAAYQHLAAMQELMPDVRLDTTLASLTPALAPWPRAADASAAASLCDRLAADAASSRLQMHLLAKMTLLMSAAIAELTAPLDLQHHAADVLQTGSLPAAQQQQVAELLPGVDAAAAPSAAQAQRPGGRQLPPALLGPEGRTSSNPLDGTLHASPQGGEPAAKRLRLGLDFQRLGSDMQCLGSDPQRLGSDPQRLGSDLQRLGSDPQRLGSDAQLQLLQGVQSAAAAAANHSLSGATAFQQPPANTAGVDQVAAGLPVFTLLQSDALRMQSGEADDGASEEPSISEEVQVVSIDSEVRCTAHPVRMGLSACLLARLSLICTSPHACMPDETAWPVNWQQRMASHSSWRASSAPG